MTAWEEKVFAAGLPAGPDPGLMEAEDGLNPAYRDWVPDNWNGQGAVAVYVTGSSSHSGLNTLLGQGVAGPGVSLSVPLTHGDMAFRYAGLLAIAQTPALRRGLTLMMEAITRVASATAWTPTRSFGIWPLILQN